MGTSEAGSVPLLVGARAPYPRALPAPRPSGVAAVCLPLPCSSGHGDPVTSPFGHPRMELGGCRARATGLAESAAADLDALGAGERARGGRGAGSGRSHGRHHRRRDAESPRQQNNDGPARQLPGALPGLEAWWGAWPGGLLQTYTAPSGLSRLPSRR